MASTVSFSGVGSGIDFNAVRDAILTSRSAPITQLQNKIGTYNNRVDSLKQLNAGLAALTSAAAFLTSRDLGAGRNAVTSDATIVTASSDATAALGQIDLNVTRLATNLTQTSRSFGSTTAPVLAGGAATATFELRKGGAATGESITIDSTNNTLAGLRDAINAKNAGVTASIVDVGGDGTRQQLVLSSKDTGQSGRVELVETTATGTLTDLNLASLNPPDGDFTRLDASFSVNGLTITRASNTVSDAVTGVTLSLKKTGAASVNITQSTDIENKLRGFVNAYNAVQDFVAGQYKKDASNRPTGVLAGDSTLRNVQQQLRSVVGAKSEDNGGTLTSLTQLGVTSTDDGHLSFDASVLNDQLKTSPEDVKALLFGKTETQKGLFQSVNTLASGLSDAVTGTVQTAITGYQSSIKNLNDTINARLINISELRTSLTKQFAAADAAIGQLNGQNTSLTNILKSLQPSGS